MTKKSVIGKLMPMLLIVVIICSTVLSLASCEEPQCEAHTDSECDGVCDVCLQKTEIKHTDTDKNGACDKCGRCAEHTDAACDGECDECGATLRIEHVDADSDGKCDRCDACGEHTDANCDRKCDECGATVALEHVDTDNDGACDRCGICQTDHVDTNCDGKCDRDGASIGTIMHMDANRNSVCDKCGVCVAPHLDEDCDGKCDRDSATVEIMHTDTDNDSECDKCGGCTGLHKDTDFNDKCDLCGKGVMHATLSVKKTPSLSGGRTLYPVHALTYNDTVYHGGEVTYTITVTNTGTIDGEATVVNPIADYLTVTEGIEQLDAGRLTWKFKIAKGESKTVTYTVRVNGDATLADENKSVSGVGATVNGKQVACEDIYIERTLNEIDREYITLAMKILSKSSYSSLDFIDRVYTMAFTQGPAIRAFIPETPELLLDGVFGNDATYALLRDAVAPSLFGGSAAPDTGELKGTANKDFSIDDLIAGDVLVIEADGKISLYMYGRDISLEFTEGAALCDIADAIAECGSATRYAVIRPSAAMLAFTPSDPDEEPEELNELQNALIKTAEAYLLRGETLQYDDTRFGVTGSASNNTSGEFRWQIDIKEPEDYTSAEWGYLNCAAFTYEVYRTALGYTLPSNMYTTANLASYSESLGMREFYFENTTPGEYTEQFKRELEAQFMAALKPGDIMVLRREDGGHAMLYTGNGKFIHSSGSSYTLTSGVGNEIYEPTIRCHRVHDYFFEPSNSSRYVFGANVQKILIVRPLNKYDGGVKESARARIESLDGIMAEKTSSHASSTTVNPGGEITYTFSIFNTGKLPATLNITDRLPEGTEYLSGCDNINGGDMSWTVTVAPCETVKISYTVRVLASAPIGTFIVGNDGKIGGVSFKCPGIYVKNTLTESEQASILSAIEALKTEGTTLSAIDLVNEIYKRALGTAGIFKTGDMNEIATGEDGVFITSTHQIGKKAASEINTDTTAYYRSMLADGLYGGYRVYSGQLKNDRTRQIMEQNLVVGDVIIGRMSSSERVFMYVGNSTFLNLTDGFATVSNFTKLCENILYYGRDFAVLRPSFVIE